LLRALAEFFSPRSGKISRRTAVRFADIHACRSISRISKNGTADKAPFRCGCANDRFPSDAWIVKSFDIGKRISALAGN